jgi:hypothetical protein
MICIKAQLACAALMLVTCVIYIIIFIVVAVKTRNESNESVMPGYNQPMSYVPAVVSQPIFDGQPPHITPVAVIPQQQHLQQPVYVIPAQPPSIDKRQSTPTITYANPVFPNTQMNISEHETSWQSKFPKVPVLILAIVQIVFIVLIIILEIASLALVVYRVTGVGIWASIAFLTASILTVILGE